MANRRGSTLLGCIVTLLIVGLMTTIMLVASESIQMQQRHFQTTVRQRNLRVLAHQLTHGIQGFSLHSVQADKVYLIDPGDSKAVLSKHRHRLIVKYRGGSLNFLTDVQKLSVTKIGLQKVRLSITYTDGERLKQEVDFYG